MTHQEIIEAAASGKTTGEIAEMMGWDRNPTSRRKIRAILGGVAASRPSSRRMKSSDPKFAEMEAHRLRWDIEPDRVLYHPLCRETGHMTQEKKTDEATRILDLFMYYECKFSKKIGKFIDYVSSNLDKVNARQLFWLRDIKDRKIGKSL